MILSMRMHNVALIEDLQLDFASGMHVMTGETGAGKSIVVDAVNLVLGGRADRDLIRTGTEKAWVEAVFDPQNNRNVAAFLSEQQLESDGIVTLYREITRSGRNLCRVCGVVERLSKTIQNELCNIVTIFLGLTVGATTNGATFLTMDTIKIVVLGVIAFGCGTAGGVLLAKLMNKLTGGKINPLIGSAGVSAVPMAARVSQKIGQQYDPGNFLLMNAMGPNVAGVIGSAVAAGVFISLFA